MTTVRFSAPPQKASPARSTPKRAAVKKAAPKKAAPKKPKPCKECVAMPSPEPGEEFVRSKHRPKVDRPAPYPGPRCLEHKRAKAAADKLRSHGRRVVKIYGITVEFYWALYEFQGGKCYICERAYGKTKRLAVDHDHKCGAGHAPDTACELCVRGLLCTTCNRKIVGHLRDDPAAFYRGAHYLEDPPAQRLRLAEAA